MDLKYTLGSEAHLVRACYNTDGADLLAVAGEHFVQVLQCVREHFPSLQSSRDTRQLNKDDSEL